MLSGVASSVPLTATIVHGPARPEMETCMPALNFVPLSEVTVKQFGFAAAHVSVLVGCTFPAAGWTVTFMEAVVVTFSASATWTALAAFVDTLTASPNASVESTIRLSRPHLGNG